MCVGLNDEFERHVRRPEDIEGTVTPNSTQHDEEYANKAELWALASSE